MNYVAVMIGGTIRGLKFNKMAHLILEEKLSSTSVISGAYGLVYAGLISNCYVKQQEPDFTFEDVCDWVDEMSDDDLFKINECFKSTEAYKKGQAYLADLEKAKKKDTPENKASSDTEPIA